MRILNVIAAVGAAAACPCGHMGCATAPPDGEEVTDLDAGGHLKGPAMVQAVFQDAFNATHANVAINPTTDGTTAAEAALGVSQSFAAILDTAPMGYTDRVPLWTAEYFVAKNGTGLAGITLTTTAAQQSYCPVTGACSASIGGVTPTAFYGPDTSDTKDSVFTDLCAARALCTGTVLVADGPSAKQWNGSAFVNFAVTGPGKPCTSGDSQPACLAKIAVVSGNFVMADSRVSLGSGITVLQLDGVTPNGTTIPAQTYPRSRQIHLLKPTTADTDSRVVAWWLWLDGDGTMAHPDHHSSFITLGTNRGFIGGSL